MGSETQGAIQIIEKFYKDYFNGSQEKRRELSLPFSRSFKKLGDRNMVACKERSTVSEICGWNVGGDVYLDSQEFDTKLNFANSKFKIWSAGADRVSVSFNVYPSEKEKQKFYDRTISFRFIKEFDTWVVDDFFLRDGSVRQRMKKEIKILSKKSVNSDI